MNNRIANLSQWMKENDIQTAFLTSPDNVFYLSGFLSDPHERLLGIAVFQDAEPFLVCPGMEKEDAKQSGWQYGIIGYSDTDRPWELVGKEIHSRVGNTQKLAIEKEHLNVERFEALTSLFPSAQFVPAEEKMRQLRAVKSPEELDKIRQACQLADFAVETGVAELKEGKTELEILAAIEFELKRKGVREMSFATMVLAGENAASPHGNPGSNRIKKGDLVLFDLGVVVDGYCSDITRTVAFGDIGKRQEEIYSTVLKAQELAVAAVRPGISCAEVDSAARSAISQAGFGDYFPHRLGHGLGISVHEFPSLTGNNPLLLEENMVFTIEPGIYVPGIAGVRIEDDVVVTASGVEILTKFPKELQIIK